MNHERRQVGGEQSGNSVRDVVARINAYDPTERTTAVISLINNIAHTQKPVVRSIALGVLPGVDMTGVDAFVLSNTYCSTLANVSKHTKRDTSLALLDAGSSLMRGFSKNEATLLHLDRSVERMSEKVSPEQRNEVKIKGNQLKKQFIEMLVQDFVDKELKNLHQRAGLFQQRLLQRASLIEPTAQQLPRLERGIDLEHTVGKFLAALGASELKAVIFGLLPSDDFIAATDMKQLIFEQSKNIGMIYTSQLKQWHTTLFAPIGLATMCDLPSKSTVGYKKTADGEYFGDALVGHMLAFSERYPSVALYNLLGSSKKESFEGVDTVRSPLSRFAILRELVLGSGSPLRTTDIAAALETRGIRIRPEILQKDVDQLVRAGYLAQGEIGTNQQSGISLIEEQRIMLTDFVRVVADFSRLDPKFLAEGRQKAAEILSDPQRVADLVAKSIEAAPSRHKNSTGETNDNRLLFLAKWYSVSDIRNRFDAPEAVHDLLAGQDVHDVAGSIFRDISEHPNSRIVGSYLAFANLILKHLRLDPNRMFGHYMQWLADPLQPENKIPYRSLGEIYAHHFPKTVDARTTLLSAWENLGFTSVVDAMNDIQFAKIQFEMLGEQETPDTHREPMLAWMDTMMRSFDPSVFHRGMDDSQKQRFRDLLQQGVSLGMTKATLYRLSGFSRAAVDRLLSPPVRRARPARQSVFIPAEAVSEQVLFDWVSRVRDAVNFQRGQRLTPEMREIVKGFIKQGLALGIYPVTMRTHMGLSRERLDKLIGEIAAENDSE